MKLKSKKTFAFFLGQSMGKVVQKIKIKKIALFRFFQNGSWFCSIQSFSGFHYNPSKNKTTTQKNFYYYLKKNKFKFYFFLKKKTNRNNDVKEFYYVNLFVLW